MSPAEVLDWLLRLGDEHGVDPVVYAVIWVGALPLFLASSAWLLRSVRRGEALTLPVVATVVFFLAPTLYVFIAGRDLPVWVYLLLGGLTLIGGVSSVRRIRARLRHDAGNGGPSGHR